MTDVQPLSAEPATIMDKAFAEHQAKAPYRLGDPCLKCGEPNPCLTIQLAGLVLTKNRTIAQQAETIRERDAQIATLTELAAQLAEEDTEWMVNAAETIRELKAALRDLLDEQNGPPLIRRSEQWNIAVGNAEAALTSTEARGYEPCRMCSDGGVDKWGNACDCKAWASTEAHRGTE